MRRREVTTSRLEEGGQLAADALELIRAFRYVLHDSAAHRLTTAESAPAVLQFLKTSA